VKGYAPAAASFGDLTPLLAPRSVAVVGASDREGNLGGLAVGFFMVAALIMSHIGLMNSQNHLFMVAQNPGGNHWDHYFLDTQMFYMLSSFAVYFLGAGKYGLNIGGKWN